ncbi:hypothetical protein [Actinocrinis sp.]|uniref:hypothetical protein n=1 Tax=Actinocrinis sp. TaxID=1920516 RepID=UPI002B897954|nr:hypothetical protein [Actinocrinis sp.]HXR74008.1 hypothetical protein [Actinocrinis sp.]
MPFTAGQRILASYLNAQVSMLQKTVLTSTTASVTFSSIPVYTRLVVFWRVRLSASGPQNILLQVDGDTNADYLWNFVDAINGTAGGSHAGLGTSSIIIGTADGNTANYFASGDLSLDGWANTSGYLTASGTWANFSTLTTDAVGAVGGLFVGVGPHSSFLLKPASGSFVAGSQFSLYGYN